MDALKIRGMERVGWKSRLTDIALCFRRTSSPTQAQFLDSNHPATLSTGCRVQLEWDGSTWSKFALQPNAGKYMPWVASRRGIEICPNDGPQDCRVIVFDCINYSVPYMRILTIDEGTEVVLAQESKSVAYAIWRQRLSVLIVIVFYNTSFSGIRSINDDNDGYVLVKGLTGEIGPESLGCMYSRLWFQTSEGKSPLNIVAASISAGLMSLTIL